MLFGSIAYDIASLIDDVRIKVSRSNREKLYSSYISNIKILDQKSSEMTLKSYQF